MPSYVDTCGKFATIVNDSNGKCSDSQEILPLVSRTLIINSLCCHWTYMFYSKLCCLDMSCYSSLCRSWTCPCGVTKRCRPSLLTNSAPHIRVQMRGEGEVAGSQPMSIAVHITAGHGAQINFGDLPQYLTYGVAVQQQPARALPGGVWPTAAVQHLDTSVNRNFCCTVQCTCVATRASC